MLSCPACLQPRSLIEVAEYVSQPPTEAPDHSAIEEDQCNPEPHLERPLGQEQYEPLLGESAPEEDEQLTA